MEKDRNLRPVNFVRRATHSLLDMFVGDPDYNPSAQRDVGKTEAKAEEVQLVIKCIQGGGYDANGQYHMPKYGER